MRNQNQQVFKGPKHTN